MDLNGKIITNDDNEEIPNAVNTLIFTIAQYFIGDLSLWKDRSAELLSNLKCRTLADFRWYRDTFLSRVYTREDSQQPFWKEKILVDLPRSLGDKIRDKFCSQSVNEDIPYNSLSYGQLISYVQKKENLNQIQQDDQLSSTDDENVQEINTLRKEQDLLFEAINSIPDPQEKKVFLNKLKKSLEAKPKPKDFITSNKFDVSNLLKRMENTSKTSEKLCTTTGSKLKINYKLSTRIIENQDLRIKTNFLLVKNHKNEVILGTPFIRYLSPTQISKGGITTWH
ncbi:hypothetical protein JHK82_016046 [Glycine max]|uniref:Uncharacterized protein n=1 Tax=Glycine max TaxID=3847 RepID=A0A0R0JK27_SOYBN|nr:hypothetical protein JHK87_015989 [Glycine soja]KAG5032464.1 hypothetical protein JHK85_016446 [Glycine max]KAG5046667.1 hypothetical protein JHK86_016073 [Glycine max]KAG5149165.1 hypothetical protein JHK82_016046 [Glycine max]KAH1127067.1 hypothetical protein GYH30_015883 [Glycine max]